jgi:hypothetical protein
MNQEGNGDKAEQLKQVLEKAHAVFSKEPQIWCPYFGSRITLNSDGFNHLLYKSNRLLRNVDEQLLKLRLLPKALHVIKKSGTLQEYRDRTEKVGTPAKDGFFKTHRVQYWAFEAILGESSMMKIVVVVRRVGDGKTTFWSVLPHKKIKNQRLFSEGIE